MSALQQAILRRALQDATHEKTAMAGELSRAARSHARRQARAATSSTSAQAAQHAAVDTGAAQTSRFTPVAEQTAVKAPAAPAVATPPPPPAAPAPAIPDVPAAAAPSTAPPAATTTTPPTKGRQKKQKSSPRAPDSTSPPPPPPPPVEPWTPAQPINSGQPPQRGEAAFQGQSTSKPPATSSHSTSEPAPDLIQRDAKLHVGWNDTRNADIVRRHTTGRIGKDGPTWQDMHTQTGYRNFMSPHEAEGVVSLAGQYGLSPQDMLKAVSTHRYNAANKGYLETGWDKLKQTFVGKGNINPALANALPGVSPNELRMLDAYLRKFSPTSAATTFGQQAGSASQNLHRVNLQTSPTGVKGAPQAGTQAGAQAGAQGAEQAEAQAGGFFDQAAALSNRVLQGKGSYQDNMMFGGGVGAATGGLLGMATGEDALSGTVRGTIAGGALGAGGGALAKAIQTNALKQAVQGK